MGQPAARITDGVLHKKGGGTILQGCETVRIEGLLASRKGDLVQHSRHKEKIITGEPTVRIGGLGLLAARVGDQVECKGCVAEGSSTVRIGRTAPGNCLKKASDQGSPYVSPHPQGAAGQAGGLQE